MLLLRAADSLSEQATTRLEKVFATDDPAWKLKEAWDVKEQVRTLLRTGPLEDAELAKEDLEWLVKESKQPETTSLRRTMCLSWKELEVLIVTGATTGKVEANSTSIKQIKRTGRGFVSSTDYTTRIMLRSAARTAVNHLGQQWNSHEPRRAGKTALDAFIELFTGTPWLPPPHLNSQCAHSPRQWVSEIRAFPWCRKSFPVVCLG